MSTGIDPTSELPVRRKTWLANLRRELDEHRVAYVVMAFFLVATPAAIPMLFPEATLGVKIFGGLILGALFAMCAMPGQFISD